MQIRFNVRMEEVVAELSPASERELNELSPITAADLAQDIMYDAIALYNRQVERLHSSFHIETSNAD